MNNPFFGENKDGRKDMKKKQKGLRRVCAWALAAAMILGGGITLPDTALTA